MKKTLINIFAVFMAVLVFYGGAGVNVISYCCKDCRSAGIEALINDKCCEIHHHDHSKTHNHKHNSSTSDCNHIAHTEDACCEPSNSMHAEDNCCESEHSESHSSLSDPTEDSCNLERIDFDWSTQNVDELKINLSPTIHDLFSTFSSANIPYICENNTVMPNGPPLVLPRDYLSVLTVLLI